MLKQLKTKHLECLFMAEMSIVESLKILMTVLGSIYSMLLQAIDNKVLKKLFWNLFLHNNH